MSTVLIVDDSHTLRQMICEILQNSGLVVIEAVNGMEAKEKIQTNAPDLVITGFDYAVDEWL
jgi:twitching motility two-component system response regulator PilH